MSNTNFWRTAYQLFKPEEPLATLGELKVFYVQRDNSPVDKLASLLAMEDEPAKFLLAGHRGGGKTTELRRLQQNLNDSYTVIWIDTQTALDRYNIGYAEILVLIGLEIARQAIKSNWLFTKEKLLTDLQESLKTVVYQDKDSSTEVLKLPNIFDKVGLILKRGLTTEVKKTLNVRPWVSEIINQVNTIINEAEKQTEQKLLIIVDGLDRHDQATALEMFSSPLLTELNCHIIYSIPIALRYSPSFRQPMESFQCLDLHNPPVFKCDENLCPKTYPDDNGRKILKDVINKRILSLSNSYKDFFHSDALELICEKSGGVMRDLIRLARTACQIGSQNKKLSCIDLETAQKAVQEVRKEYNLSDYHYPELDSVHRTGQLTTKTHSLPNRGEFIICDELLQNKLVLGYYNSEQEPWFDINPILLEDLQRWQAVNKTI